MAETQDLFNALRDLANKWAMKARDYARDSKTPGMAESTAAHNRGMADGYYKAAVELAEFLKAYTSAPKPAAAPAPAAAHAPTQPSPAAPEYLNLPIGEVIDILTFAGTNVRDVTQDREHRYTGIFSRWENLMPHERLDKIKAADSRIVILDSGKVKDTGDHFVVFAFKRA